MGIVTHARVCYNHDGIGETVGGEFPPGLIENCTEGEVGDPPNLEDHHLADTVTEDRLP